MKARATVAAQLIGQGRATQGVMFSFMGMSLLGRMRWVVFGPTYSNWKGTVGLVVLALAVLALIGGAYLR